MSKIVVGVDESQGSSDAIALASSLAGITGAGLTLVNVFPYDHHPSRAVNRAFEEYLRRDSDDLLEHRRSTLGDESVELRAIPNVSPAHGLHALAEKQRAGLIVVGSTQWGGLASYNDALHERAGKELESAIATIDAELGVEAEFKVGDAAEILTAASEQLDLLVVGSRGYGPMHAVMIGGVAGRLVRDAACPVIVVPRGAGHTEADSLFAKSASAAHR